MHPKSFVSNFWGALHILRDFGQGFYALWSITRQQYIKIDL